jgi:hypothetical protein
MNMAIAIDYKQLWRRAVWNSTFDGRTMVTLAPEDALLSLAVRGGIELWCRISLAYDFARLIDSRPALDWAAIYERSRAQGCLRILLIGTALARRYLGVSVPNVIVAAEHADRAIEPLVQHVVRGWLARAPVGPSSAVGLTFDRLRLHDGMFRRAQYLMRILVWPAPHHIRRIPLPERLSSLSTYVPVKFMQDCALLPAMQILRNLHALGERLGHALAASRFALAVIPFPAETKRRLKLQQAALAAARRAVAASPRNPSVGVAQSRQCAGGA